MNHLLTDLKRSGLTPADAKRMQCKATTHLGRPAYLLYSFDRDKAINGQRHRFLDNLKPRYAFAKGVAPTLHWPTNFDWRKWTGERLLYITEGIKKAEVACKLGIPTVALDGVWNFRVAGALIPALAGLDWDNVTPYIVYDSDAVWNPIVRMAESQLFLAIQRCHASQPASYIVRIPGPKGEKIALDDLLLQRNGLEKFNRARDKSQIGSVFDVRDQYLERVMAEAFAAEHHDSLRYLTDAERWVLFEDGRWRREESRVRHALGEFLKRSMPVYPTKKEQETMEDDGAQVVAAITRVRKQLSSAHYEEAVIKLAAEQPAIAAQLKDFDRNPMLLGIPDGDVVDLTTGNVRPAVATDMVSRSTEVIPSAKADCPLWKQFVREIAPAEVGSYLQRFAGHCTSGSVREEVLHTPYGPGGNGKGTFWGTVKKILGDDYAVDFPMEALIQRRYVNDYSTQNDLARLLGARLAIADEGEKQHQLNADLIKRMSGGEGTKLTAKLMGKDKFTFDPTHKLVLLLNHKPRVEVDDAMRRRLHLVPLLQRWSSNPDDIKRGAKKADTELKENLFKEAPGILRWMIDGCLAWQKEGLAPPKVVTDYTTEFFSNADPYVSWLTDRGHGITPDNFTPTVDLFADWRGYCLHTNQMGLIGNVTSFSQDMEKLTSIFRKTKKTNGTGTKQARGFYGLTLNISSVPYPKQESK